MPKGPQGQKRPADSVGMSVMVGKIATGDHDDVMSGMRGASGGKARATKLSAERRSEIATRAASARWKGKETSMTQTLNACDTVAAVYEKKRAEGLIDVKFLLQSPNEISKEEACAELLEFNEALSNGDSVPLDFGDLKWKSIN